MKILVVDGQGGSIGRQLLKMILEKFPEAKVLAVGTNSIATANMLKEGRVDAATGENAVVVGCRWADVIVGTMGIVIADALYGEVTPRMAQAVGQSDAVRVLIPMNKCSTLIAGMTSNISMQQILEDAMKKIEEIAVNRCEN